MAGPTLPPSASSAPLFDTWPVLDRGDKPGAIASVALDGPGQRLYVGLQDGTLEEYRLVWDAATSESPPSASRESHAVNDRPCVDIASLAGAGGGARRPRLAFAARRPVAKAALVDLLWLPPTSFLAARTAQGQLLLVDARDLTASPLTAQHPSGSSVSAPATAVAAYLDPPKAPRLAAVLAQSSRAGMRSTSQALLHIWQIFPRAAEEGARRGSAATGTLFHGIVPQLDPRAASCVSWMSSRALLACAGRSFFLWRPLEGAADAPVAGLELFAVPDEGAPPRAVGLPRARLGLLLGGGMGIVVDEGGAPVGGALDVQGVGPVVASGGFRSCALFLSARGALRWVECRRGGGEEPAEVGGASLGGGGSWQASDDEAPSPAISCSAVCLEASPRPRALRPAGEGATSGAEERALAACAVAAPQAVFLALERPPAARAQALLTQGRAREALRVAAAALDADEDCLWAQVCAAACAAPLLSEGQPEAALGALRRCGHEAFDPGLLALCFGGQLAGLEEEARALRASSALAAPAWVGEGGRSVVQLDGAGCRVESLAELPPRPSSPVPRLAFIEYFFHARAQAGSRSPALVDTVLLRLLVEDGSPAPAAAFAGAPNAVLGEAVADELERGGWLHALASLLAARGRAEEALELWRRFLVGEGDESETGSAAAAASRNSAEQRRDALERACDLLSDPSRVSASYATQSLPWLLACPGSVALKVLKARPELQDPEAVLKLVPPGSLLGWQFLEHVVAAQRPGGESAGRWDTQLALQLVAAMDQAHGPGGEASSGDGEKEAEAREARRQAARRRWRCERIGRGTGEGESGDREDQSYGREDRSYGREDRSYGSREDRSYGRENQSDGRENGDDRENRGTESSERAFEWRCPPAPESLDSSGTCSSLSSPRHSSDRQSWRPFLRDKLQRHLCVASPRLDCAAALEAVAAAGNLADEAVILLLRSGDAAGAVAELSLGLGDPVAAATCAAQTLRDDQLVPLFLAPLLLRRSTNGTEQARRRLGNRPSPAQRLPGAAAAAYALSRLGSRVSASALLDALPGQAPLGELWPVLQTALLEAKSRARAARLRAAWQLAEAAAQRARWAALEGGAASVDAERACDECGTYLGSKVFAAVGSGCRRAGQALAPEDPFGEESAAERERRSRRFRMLCYNCAKSYDGLE